MKTLLVLAVGMIGFGSVSAVAAPLRYEFDFAPTSNSGPISFFYLATSPTLPGTVLSNVQSSAPAAFPVVAGRDLTGAWAFTWMGSPTFSFTYIAGTDLGFANSPGVYPNQPAMVTSNIMFVTNTVPGTLAVSIQTVPEPETVLLMLPALAMLGYFKARTLLLSGTTPVKLKGSAGRPDTTRLDVAVSATKTGP